MPITLFTNSTFFNNSKTKVFVYTLNWSNKGLEIIQKGSEKNGDVTCPRMGQKWGHFGGEGSATIYGDTFFLVEDINWLFLFYLLATTCKCIVNWVRHRLFAESWWIHHNWRGMLRRVSPRWNSLEVIWKVKIVIKGRGADVVSGILEDCRDWLLWIRLLLLD